MTQALACLNGELMPLAEAKVPALDRGFLFGDAVYEVLRVYGGKPFLLDGHLERLNNSLTAIRINGVDLERLQRRMLKTLTLAKCREAIIYIQITRGSAPRTHAFPVHVEPLEFLFVEPFQDSYVRLREEGAAVSTHPDIRWERCDIKSTNLLGNVLATQDAKEHDAVEAIFYLPDGTLTEGARTSFFGICDDVLITAPTTPAILPGITRSLIFDLARSISLSVQEHPLLRAELNQVQELFLTGTTAEVLPVVRVDQLVIGGGRPGPRTQQLQQAFRGHVEEFVRAD